MKSKYNYCAASTLVAAVLVTSGVAIADDKISGPIVGRATAQVTRALGSLPKAKANTAPVYIRPRHNPLAKEQDHGLRGTDRKSRGQRPHVTDAPRAPGIERATPATLLSFEGQGNSCSCSPPDTAGDAGPNHYVQIVNATKVAVYDKAGVLQAGFPKEMSALFSSGNCAASSIGDPVVLYDSLADRWLLAQFSTGNGVCVAISQTPDPAGTYFGYEFLTPDFPDYLKFGVWRDGYYMSTNESTYAAYALDRSKMLAGQAATSIRFDGVSNFMLPGDVDGGSSPPAGDPNYFYTFKDSVFHGVPNDRLEIREFHADFATPANSTFALTDTINVTPFVYTVCGFFVLNCIPQGGTAQKVDAVSEWPMFRFPYRNFGTYQAVAGTFTIEGATANTGAVRWFELRKAGGNWSLFQQGTIDSNDGVSRFMSSIAMDGVGNLAVGYSASGASLFPAIRYAVHRIGDALGTMQPEATLQAGGGSQTGSNRWGDYSTMAIDPSDDATFWYTSEYYPASASSAWHTRVGTFKILELLSFRSQAANDGDIRETTEASTAGGPALATATTLRLGDSASDQQFRAIVDFDTSSLPDTAVIASVVLKTTKVGAVAGSDPFASLGKIAVDIQSGGISGVEGLQSGDFQAVASKANAGVMRKPASGAVHISTLKATARAFVNRTGHTQLRLRFQTGDNDNATADQLRFASGEHATSSLRPQLVVKYYVP